MATKKTRSELGAIWITGYVPTQADYENMHLSVHLDEDGIASYANTVSTIKFDNPLRGNTYGSDSAPLTGSVTLDTTNAAALQSAVVYHNGISDPFATLPANTQKWNYTYTPGELNIITLIYHSSTLITLSCRSADASSTGAPYATAVSFTGTLQQGQTLTGVYTYNDDEGDLEGTTTFRWLRTPTGGSNFVAVAGAINQTYVLQSGDVNYDFRFEVTVVAASGDTLVGDPVQSATRGPILAASFTETDLSNIITYLNFANDSSITAPGTIFASATDSNLTTSNDWEKNAGSPVYDDANDKLTFPSGAISQIRVDTTDVGNLPALDDPRTYCVALRSDYNNTAFQYWLYRNTADYFLLQNNDFKIRSNGVTYSSTSNVPNIDNQGNHILIIRSDSVNGTQVRIDGNIIAGGWTGSHSFNFPLNSLHFWGFSGNTTNSYQGDIYKILITEAYMDDVEVVNLETKWLSDYSI